MMWYLLVHFESNYVTGFLAPGHVTKKEALRMVKSQLIKAIHFEKHKMETTRADSRHYVSQRIDRLKCFVKALKRPWRKKGGWHRVEFQKLDNVLNCGFWLEEIVTGENTCNILPRESLYESAGTAEDVQSQ